MSRRIRLVLFLALSSAAAAATAQPAADRPWLNPALSPEQRADLAVQQMTQDEKLQLVFGYFASTADWKANYTPPAGVRFGSAGFIPGIPRLGIPSQWETDAGIGVATQGAAPKKRERTALPSGIAKV